MDFIAELIFQLVVQVLIEIVGDFLLRLSFRTAAGIVRSDFARRLTGSVLGVVFGLAWGAYLSGNSHWPRLLWVSLALGATAFVLAVGRPRDEPRQSLGLRQAVQPPWRWSATRLLDFALLNAAIAAGIAIAFRPG